MTDQELLKIAEDMGFCAAILKPEQIPVNPGYRMFCVENRCGKFGTNYSCPPECGDTEALHQRLLDQDRILIVSSQWEINGYEDTPAIADAMQLHNEALICLLEQLRSKGWDGFAAGYNGCPVCKRCKSAENKPCPCPEKQIGCMSAYCVDVAKLAEKTALEYTWSQNKLYLFGMVTLHRK